MPSRSPKPAFPYSGAGRSSGERILADTAAEVHLERPPGPGGPRCLRPNAETKDIAASISSSYPPQFHEICTLLEGRVDQVVRAASAEHWQRCEEMLHCLLALTGKLNTEASRDEKPSPARNIRAMPTALTELDALDLSPARSHWESDAQFRTSTSIHSDVGPSKGPALMSPLGGASPLRRGSTAPTNSMLSPKASPPIVTSAVRSPGGGLVNFFMEKGASFLLPVPKPGPMQLKCSHRSNGSDESASSESGKKWTNATTRFKHDRALVNNLQKNFYMGGDIVQVDGFFRRIALSSKSQIFCVVVSVFNGICCALQADCKVHLSFAELHGNSVSSLEDQMKIYWWLQVSFVLWLVIELMINLLALRGWFFLGESWKWNLFDVFILMCSVLELCGAKDNRATGSKIIRFARLGKIMQAFRTVKFFHGLQKMIVSLGSCFVTLFWAVVLVFIIVYLVSIIFLHGVAEYVGECDPLDGNATESSRRLDAGIFNGGGGEDVLKELFDLYGSFGKSVLTLFRAVSGSDWGALAAPLNKLGPLFGVVWALYIGFMVFGVLNILTGIFVEESIKAAESDCSIAVQDQLEKEEELLTIVSTVFMALDSDGSDELSRAEFDRLLDNDRIMAHLSSIGIEMRKAKNLFDLLDDDRSGYLTLEEVVAGLMQSQGDAKAVEILGLRRDMKNMQRHIFKIQRALGIARSSSSVTDQGKNQSAPVLAVIAEAGAASGAH